MLIYYNTTILFERKPFNFRGDELQIKPLQFHYRDPTLCLLPFCMFVMYIGEVEHWCLFEDFRVTSMMQVSQNKDVQGKTEKIK